MDRLRVRRATCCALAAALLPWAAACASVSTSETRTALVDGSTLRLSARAERGSTADHLFVVVNGEDVVDGPFGAAEAAGTVLRGEFQGFPVVAECRHRWRPGLRFGYRCLTRIGEAEAVTLDF